MRPTRPRAPRGTITAPESAMSLVWRPCFSATSFGNYKEMRSFLLHSPKLREDVKKILAKLGRLVDGKLLIPEEIVHYSEWLHVMRNRIREHQVVDCSSLRATI